MRTAGLAAVMVLMACPSAVVPPRVPEPAPVVVAPIEVAKPVEAEAAPEVAAAEETEEVEPAALPWPADVPVLPGVRVIEVARISAGIGDSPDGATFVAGRGELQAFAEAWIAAAQARGFRVLAVRFDDHVRTASLSDGSGRRANLLLQRSDDGEVAGVFDFGAQKQVLLAGPCVEVPLRERVFEVDRGGITHDGGFRREVVEIRMAARLGYDFDRDGELDVLVPTKDPARCPDDLMWTVYLARGGCAHAVGVVGPGDLSMGGVEAGTGPRALEFQAESTVLGDGGVVKTTVATRYEFRGGRYVRVKRTPSEGVCHHCPWGECKEVR